MLLELISSWSPRDHDEGRFLLLSFGYSRELRESVQPGDILVDIFALCARVLRTLQVRFWVHRHGVGMTWNGHLRSLDRADTSYICIYSTTVSFPFADAHLFTRITPKW